MPALKPLLLPPQAIPESELAARVEIRIEDDPMPVIPGPEKLMPRVGGGRGAAAGVGAGGGAAAGAATGNGNTGQPKTAVAATPSLATAEVETRRGERLVYCIWARNVRPRARRGADWLSAVA